MAFDDEDAFADDAAEAADAWEACRGEDGAPIGMEECTRLNWLDMPEDVRIWVRDHDVPETTGWRAGAVLICELPAHLYTNDWEHQFSAYACAAAMESAARRLAHDGHPLANPSRDDEDGPLVVRWQRRLPCRTTPAIVVEAIKSAFDVVWPRADSILAHADAVLVLGKATGPA